MLLLTLGVAQPHGTQQGGQILAQDVARDHLQLGHLQGIGAGGAGKMQ